MHGMKKRLRRAAAVWLAAAMTFSSMGFAFPVTAEERLQPKQRAENTASDSEADPGKDGNWLEITDGEEMTETETEKDKEEQKEDVIIETASDSNADQGQISYENVYWGLTGAGGRLVDENGIEKNQLQREKGQFLNEDGAALEIDTLSEGKFAPDAGNSRTQVNGGTKISVPVEGDICLLTITAHKNWRGSDSQDEDARKESALKTAGISGAESVTLESIEVQEDANYEAYTYRCVLGEDADSITINVQISGSAYLKSIASQCIHMPSVTAEGSISLEGGLAELPEDLQIIAENLDTGDVFYGRIIKKGTEYTYEVTVKLEESASFRIRLSDSRYTVLDGAEFEPDPDQEIYTSDITIGENAFCQINGAVLGYEESFDASGVRLVFTPQEEGGSIPETVMGDDGRSYSAELEKGMTYEISLAGTGEYRIAEGEELFTADQGGVKDIHVAAKPRYTVAVDWSEEASAVLGDLADQIIFIYEDENGYTYSFAADDTITLPEGIYTLRAEGLDAIPYELSGSRQISVTEDVTQKLRLKEVTSWLFYDDGAGGGFTGTIQNEMGYYKGIAVDAVNGKLSYNGSNSAQFNAGTKLSVPVKGNCQISVEAHSGSTAFYTINGEPADQTTAVTAVDYTGGAGTISIVSTGSAYIRSISVIYPGNFEPDHEQDQMPEIAAFGSPGNLEVDAEGWTLTFAQTGGVMEGTDAVSDTVSYFLFPETAEWDTLEADIQVLSGKTSNTSGVFFGAFDGRYMAAAGIRGTDNVRGIYSKTGEAAGAGGANADIEPGTSVSFRAIKTDDGYTVSAVNKEGLSALSTFSYDDALLFAEGKGNTACRYGLAFADVTVQVTNLKLTAEDGSVLYDQTKCYDPAGYAPEVSAVTGEAAPSRQYIHVSWIGEECEGDGRYRLQVSTDGSAYTDVAADLTEASYDFPVENAGDYRFRVCGILGADEDSCTAYAEMAEPVHIIPALTSPVVTLAGTTNSVTLTWTQTEEAVRYEVWRYSFDETAENARVIGETDGSTLTYTDTAVEQQQPYYYYVIAYSENNANWSNPSETVWTVVTDVREGQYVYEDQAVPVTITEKTNDTVRSSAIAISGIAEKACSLQAEVNGQIQTGDISLAAGGTFTVTLTLEEGRNDVNLYFTDSNGRITRKTFNYVLLTNYDMVVDGNWAGADGALEDGIPVYRTVQAAVDAVPADNSSRKVILIREGSYREHLRVDKPMISLIGEDQEKVRIHFYDAEESPEGGDMALRCAVYVTEAAAGFSAENLTFENDYEYTGAGGNESADALRNDASETVYVNVAIRGFQDTLCANRGEQYYYKCRILGNVDFIYGNEPRAFFEDCDLIFRYSSTKNSGYVAAPRTAAEAEYGLTFYNCRILSEDGCSGDKYLLARPWGADACIAFLDCYMGSIINAEAPYDDMSGNSFMAARFFEYGTYGPGFAINPSRRQISPARADAMIQPELLGWDPYDAASLLGQDYIGELGTEDPTTPEEPVDPEDPTEPVDPEDPENPTDPTDPENPSEPTDPQEPGEPEQPEEPSDPGTSEGNEPPGNSGNGSSGGGSSSGGSSSGGGSSRTDSRSQLAQYYIEVRQAQEVRADAVLVLPTAQGDWAQAADTTWRFVKTDGTLAKNEWQLVNNFWYHFDGNGLMQNGWIQTPDGRWYYLDLQSGAMKTGWNLINGKWYYLDAVNGHCLINTITPDGYRVDSTGAAIL